MSGSRSQNHHPNSSRMVRCRPKIPFECPLAPPSTPILPCTRRQGRKATLFRCPLSRQSRGYRSTKTKRDTISLSPAHLSTTWKSNHRCFPGLGTFGRYFSRPWNVFGVCFPDVGSVPGVIDPLPSGRRVVRGAYRIVPVVPGRRLLRRESIHVRRRLF